MTDALANILIQRNCVAKTRAAGMRSGGEKTIISRMSAIHVGMRHTAEHSEIVAMLFQTFKIGREGVAAAAVFRKEAIGDQTEVVTDAEEAARLPAGSSIHAGPPFGCGREGRRHRVEHWQCKKYACAAQERAPRQALPRRNERRRDIEVARTHRDCLPAINIRLLKKSSVELMQFPRPHKGPAPPSLLNTLEHPNL